jgi:hypothetical protein
MTYLLTTVVSRTALGTSHHETVNLKVTFLTKFTVLDLECIGNCGHVSVKYKCNVMCLRIESTHPEFMCRKLVRNF